MKRRTRYVAVALVAGGLALSCDEGRLLTELETQPFESQLDAVTGPDTLFATQQAAYSTTLWVGETAVAEDVMAWDADPKGILQLDTANHSTSMDVRGRAPGTATLTATVDHADFREQQESRTVTVVLLGVAPVAPATGDTVITALGDPFTIVARGIGQNGATADSAGLTWDHRGSAISVAEQPLDGHETLQAEAAAVGTDTLIFRQRDDLCVQGQCVDTIYIHVQPAPDRVEAQDTLRLATFGSSKTASVTVYDRNDNPIPGAAIDWSVADPADTARATVAPGGAVTAHGNGTARIVATAGSATDTVVVLVEQVIHQVTASPDLNLTALGASDTVSLAASDSGGAAVTRAYTVQWTSRSVSVASVSALGDGRAVAMAEATGSTYVVGEAESQRDSVLVDVTQAAATVVVTPDSVTLDALGAQTQLDATVEDANGNAAPDAPVTWTSLDEAIVEVSEAGEVTGKGVGAGRVVGASGDAADTAVITVRQVPASITVTDSLALDALTATGALTAVVEDGNGNPAPGAAVSWTVLGGGSAIDLAVDGEVTAVANGTATVEGRAGTVADTATVVVAQAVDSMDLAPSALSYNALALSDTVEASAFDRLGQPFGPDPAVTWSSDDSDVATVSPVFGDDDRAVVSSVGDGATWIRAEIDGVQDSLPVTVGQAVDTVVVAPLVDTLDALGATRQLSAEPRDANGQTVATAVTWASTDTNVATVDASGLVTAAATGTVDISASADSRTTTATITVRQVPASITVTDTAALVAIGEIATLTATVRDAEGTTIPGAPLTWTVVSGSGVISLASDGDVTAQANGTAKVEGASGDARDTAVVQVEQAVDSVDIATTALSYDAFLVADTIQVTAFDPGGTAVARPYTVAWSSSAPAVASVTQLADTTRARVESKGDGTARIDATVEGKLDSVTVTVTQAVDSVVITPTADTINALGSTTQLAAQPVDSNLQDAGEPVTWAALDTAIATIDGSATVTAVATGTARFTAAAGGVEDTATVLVRQIAETITISPDPVTDTLLAGDKTQLSVAVADSNGNAIAAPDVAWTAAPDTTATVDSTGLVSGRSVTTLDSAWVTAVSGPARDSVRVFVNTAVLTSVSVAPDSDTITALTETAQLVAEGLNQNGNPIPGETFTWESRDTNVATVGASSGTVTAVAAGQTYVVATSDSVPSLEDSALVVVEQVVASVTILPAVDTFTAHSETRVFKARAFDAKGQYVGAAAFTFTDDLSGLVGLTNATDTTVEVTSQSNGDTEVYAEETGTGSGLVDTAAVTVTQVPDSIAVAPADTTINVGQTVQLAAVVTDANGADITGADVSWRVLVLDTATASVDGTGLVTGKNAGTARVVANPTGHGTIVDTAAVTVEAHTLVFDGDDYATAGTGLNLDATTEAAGFTVEAWVYPTSGAGDEYIVSKGGTASNGDKGTASYGLYLKGGKPAFYLRHGNAPTHVDSLVAGSALTTNAWHHVAITFDNADSTATLYVNGSSVATATLAGTPVSGTGTVFVGASGTTPGNPFTGRLDELRVWSGVRTGTEIADTYQTALTGAEAGLRAYWSFDAGTGNPADLTGNGNTMTLPANPNDPTYNAEFPSIP